MLASKHRQFSKSVIFSQPFSKATKQDASDETLAISRFSHQKRSSRISVLAAVVVCPSAQLCASQYNRECKITPCTSRSIKFSHSRAIHSPEKLYSGRYVHALMSSDGALYTEAFLISTPSSLQFRAIKCRLRKSLRAQKENSLRAKRHLYKI